MCQKRDRSNLKSFYPCRLRCMYVRTRSCTVDLWLCQPANGHLAGLAEDQPALLWQIAQCLNRRTILSDIFYFCCFAGKIFKYVLKEKLQTFRAFKKEQIDISKHNITKTVIKHQPDV